MKHLFTQRDAAIRNLIPLCGIFLLFLSGCASSPEVTKADPVNAWNVHLSHAAPNASVADEPASTVKPPAVSATEYFGVEGESKASGKDKKEVIKENAKRIDFNFQDADVRGVIGSVLGDMLKLNYSIDPAVQGKITLRTGRSITADSALPALEAALSTVSAAIVVEEGIVQVIPMDVAPQRVHRAQRTDVSRGTTPGFAVEIIPLRYVGAKDMQKVLEAFAPKGSILQADEVHNHLVIAGTSQERSAILQTVEGFDADGMQGMAFALYKVKQTSPDQLIGELKQIFQPPMELVTQRVRLVPIARLQSILGISKYRADLELIESWIQKLDGESKSSDRRLFVYNIQNGSAKDLAKSLQLVINGEPALNAPPVPLMPAGSRDLNQSPQTGAAAPLAAPPMAQMSQGKTQTRIVANEENNSLLIFSSEQEYRDMREVLRQLDAPPRQVMIEAMIAEVKLGGNLNYGVQWFFNSGKNAMTLSNSTSGSLGAQFPGFSYIYSGSVNAQVVVNALQSQTNVKILSAPKLSVLNNQKAELLVGDQVPVLTQTSQATASPGAPIISTVQMLDTGISLEITPRISENGNVILDVTQEVSQVTATTTSGIDSPTVQKRRIHSVVATHDGATVALGGLISEEKDSGKSGVPLLSSLPLVGNLFRSNTSSNTRTELIILLVPHVMRDPAETQAVVDALVESMPATFEFTNHAAPVHPKQGQ